MKTHKRIISAVVIVTAFFLLPQMAAALDITPETVTATAVINDEMTSVDRNRTIKRTVDYRTLDPAERYEFERVVTTDNGRELTLDGVTYESIETATHRFADVKISYPVYGLATRELPAEYRALSYINTINGKTLRLPAVNTNYTDIPQQRTGTVETMVDYGLCATVPKPYSKLNVNYTDSLTGETLTGTVDYVELVRKSKPRWLDDVVITIKAEIYESAFYRLGESDTYIPYNDNSPAVIEYSNEIMAALGIDSATTVFKTSQWTTPVQKEDGKDVRYGVINGSRYAAEYVARYAAEWELPYAEGFDAVVTYGANVDVLDGIEEYTIRATATYTDKSLSTVQIVIISFGGVLLATAITVVLFVLKGKHDKKKGKENGRKKGLFQKH